MECTEQYPFDIIELDEERGERIRVGPKKICLYKPYKDEVLLKFYNFKSRPDDVWVFGHARSGTTLAQEIIWLIANDFDYKKASEDIMDVRFPVFELSGYFANKFDKLKEEKLNYSLRTQKIIDKWARPTWEALAEMKGRRFIKTHIPISLANPDLLNSGAKIIYIARNPKDTAVSYYLLEKSLKGVWNPSDDFEVFFKQFKNWNLYFQNLKEGWELRNHKNVLFLFYEEYKKDLRKTIKTISDFLGKSPSDDEIEKLEDHLRIDNFRNNRSVNNDHLRELNLMQDKEDQFIRKGKDGGWTEYFRGKLNDEADQWIADNLRDTDLKFPDA